MFRVCVRVYVTVLYVWVCVVCVMYLLYVQCLLVDIIYTLDSTYTFMLFTIYTGKARARGRQSPHTTITGAHSILEHVASWYWYINLTIHDTIYPSQYFSFGAAFVCQDANFWTLPRISLPWRYTTHSGCVFYSPLSGFSLLAFEVTWSHTATRHSR